MKFRIVILAIGLALALALASAAAGSDRPNILLIFTDDQGINDVGCYGSEIPTPHIDRIAAEGVKFTNFYSASAICTPSRFGLLTGRNPSRSKHQLLSALMFMADEHKSTGIQPDETTIAEVLQAASYDTALIGKWHLGHGQPELLPTRHGFDRFIGHTAGCIDFFTMTYGLIPDWYHQEKLVSENGYATELITDEAVEFLTERKGAEKDPFFLYLAYNAPHFGKGYSPKDAAPVNLMQPQAADLKRVASIDDKIRREFAAMVVSLDDGVGRVLEALDECGLAKDTLVIFLTDHGGDPVYGGSNAPLRGDKATLFEGGIRVPCLMRWPGKIEAGSTNESLAWSLDLFPTFGNLAGAEFSRQLLDGNDLAPALFEGAPMPERAFFWELGAHEELERKPWSAVRDGDWKYVQTPADGEFLFNLADDPNEQNDRAKTDPERLQKFRNSRDDFAEQVRR